MDTPDLIIPIRMDPSKATAALAKVGAAGKKAGDDVDSGAKKSKSGLQGLESGAGTAAKSLLDLTRAQIGFSAIKAAAGAVGEEFKRAADYVKSLAEDFAELRKTMAELAALKGEPNSNKFTVEEAKKGQRYGLSPQENRRFQEEFMNFAGSQVGDEKDAAGKTTGRVAKGAKFTTAQGEEFSSRIAALMKTAGIDPSVGATLGGAMLQQAKGSQDVDKLMKDFQETFAIAQKGPTPLKEMMPQLQRIMAHDISAQEAAKMFNVVATASGRGEEGTSVEAAIKAIQEMKNDNTGEQFGVTRGMSDMEAIRAFSENITNRKKKLMAAGADEKKAMDDIEALLAEEKVVPDQRQARGLVRGFAQQGVEKEGFTQYEEIQKAVHADYEKTEVEKYKRSDQGKRDAIMIRQEVGRAEKGAELQKVQDEIEFSRTQVIESGELQEPSLALKVRGMVGSVSGVSAEQQLANRETLVRLGRRATDIGVENPYDDRTRGGAANVAEKSTILPQLEINKEIKELLEKIAAASERSASAATKDEAKKAADPGPPLAAPPAGGAGARQ